MLILTVSTSVQPYTIIKTTVQYGPLYLNPQWQYNYCESLSDVNLFYTVFKPYEL